MTAFQNCLAEIKKAAGRDLSDDEIDDLVTELQRRQRKNIDKADGTERAAMDAAEKYAKDMADAAAIEKRNALLNFKRRTEALDYIRTNFADDPALGMEALLVGANRAVSGARASVARSQTALAWYYGSGFQTDIEKLGLWKVYVRGELDQDIARALWAKGRGEDITGIPNEAKQIADVMHKWQEVMRLDANEAGAWIGKMDGYIVRQSHDMRKISKAGYEAWRNEIMPRLDWDRTLGGWSGDPSRTNDFAMSDLPETIRDTTGKSREALNNFLAHDGEQGVGITRRLNSGGIGRAKSSHTSTVRDALDTLVDEDSLPEMSGVIYRHLKGKIMEAIPDLKVHVVTRDEMNKLWSDRSDVQAAGFYDDANDHIVVVDEIGEMSPEVRSHVVMHEMVHAATVQEMRRNINVRVMAMSTMDTIKIDWADYKIDGKPLGESYAFKDEYEFIAEAMTNPKFQEALRNITIRSNIKSDNRLPTWRKVTAWDALMQVLRKAFGLPAGKDVSALEMVVSITEHAMNPRISGASDAFSARWREARPSRRGRAPRQYAMERSAIAGDSDVEKFLKEVYAGLASGVHLKAQDQTAGGFKGPRNIAKKASAERVLHFKTADDWFDYNQKFGMGNLRESFLRGLELNAQNTGLMQKLGPNPESNLDQIHQRIMRGIKDPQKRQDLQTKFDSTIRNQFLEVDGSTRSPVHAQRARIAASARAWENLTKLGMALLSQISDLPTHASEMKYQGNRGYLSNVGDAVAGMFYNRSTKERIELEGMLSILRDGMLGDAGVRFSLANDELPGRISRLQQLFFKYNGMTPWTDRLKATAVRAMSHYLALNRASPYSELSPELQRALRIQGIDDARWEILRSGVTKEVDGRQYMIPESVETLPDEMFDGLLAERALKANERNYARVKRELADQLRGYFADRAEFAVVTPDARTRAMMRRGTRPGTVAGEFLRFVGQFKSFPFAVIQKVMGREMYGRGSNSLSEAMRNGNGELAGLGQLLLWTTAFGYIAMSAKDLAKGRTPRDPLDYKTWMAAFVQGGGAGIYGDFLFGEVRNRFGGGLVSTLAGPVAGTVEDLADLYGRVRDGDDFAAQTFRVFWSHLPGANLFYTKLALDYMFLWSVQEAINPGSLKRMERRVEKENAQTFLLSPSASVR